MAADTPDRAVATGTGLALTSVASVQFGAALAARLFPLVGPVGTVAVRLVGAALVLALVTRPWRRRFTRAELGASAVFGAVFTAMNVSLYLAIDRLPLATVITLEFLGPLSVAVLTAGAWRVRLWSIPAAAGVVLLGGSLSADDLTGVLFALTAACCWASYILLSGRIGRQGTGLVGLSLASALAALVMVPIGLASAGTALLQPHVLAVGLAVGVLASAIPYSLDLLSLRRLPTAVFGVLTSLNPAVAALAGFVVLGETVPLRHLSGIALVVVASIGVTVKSTGSKRSRTRPTPRAASKAYGRSTRGPRRERPDADRAAVRA